MLIAASLQKVAELETNAHCIALAAQSPPAILKVWYEDDDPRLPLISSGVAYTAPRWGNGAAAPYDIDPDRVRTIIESYRQFRGDHKPIDTALFRLSETWGGWNLEERSIDPGISLEAVLMHLPGKPKGENNEISYKLGVRASWLVGATLDERLAMFKKVRRLYDFRSKAVHSGKIETKPEKWQALDEEIELGIALTGRIIIALLARGAWPKWDELVLGGDSREEGGPIGISQPGAG
jgi:hypothetical protein